MTSIDKNKCDLLEGTSASGTIMWSNFIGLSQETPKRRSLASDRQTVLLIAGATTCGFVFVSAVLFFALL
ncbi:hypothetical protein [Variovorax sp. HJSM1_2]|uniref:hypothetical protein n=1 Tax=Variovorax sp. HJSM1_2 TaxID=3366263 RepID=UPI003BCD8645